MPIYGIWLFKGLGIIIIIILNVLFFMQKKKKHFNIKYEILMNQ